MAPGATIKLFISLVSEESDAEEFDREYLRLLSELKQNSYIETISRIPREHPENTDRNLVEKGVIGFISGVLTAEISAESIRPVFSTLYERLSNHSIELEVESQNRRLKVSARNRADLDAAIQQATNFVSQEVAK